MKLFHLAMAALVLAVAVTVIPADEVPDYRNLEYTREVSTMAPTCVGGYLPGRRYYLVINESENYDLRHATYPLTQANIARNVSKGKILRKNYGNWEDMYNVYIGSWWVIISSPTCPANTLPLKCTAYWYERD